MNQGFRGWPSGHPQGVYASSVITVDVACPTAGTFYDGPSISLGAGVWMVWATVTGFNGTGGASIFEIKLWDGLTPFASTEIFAGTNAQDYSLSLSAIVPGGATVKVSGSWNNNNGVLAAATTAGAGGATAKATQINALRIA